MFFVRQMRNISRRPVETCWALSLFAVNCTLWSGRNSAQNARSSLAQAGLGDQTDTEFYNCDDVTIPRVQDPSSLAHCSMQHCMTAA